MVILGPTELYQPRPGDIGLTQISGWGGKGIRLAQWLNGDGFADYQHAFVVTEYRQGLLRPWIVEAMPGGAQHVKNWHDPARTHWLICPEPWRSSVASAARGYTGVPYSYLDYASLAAHRLHIPAPHLRRYIRDSGHMICSQLADAAADAGGWNLFTDGRWAGDVTPGDLNRLWTELPERARA